MPDPVRDLLDRAESAYRAAADPALAAPMAAYMRDRFQFLGIRTPRRRDLDRELLPAVRDLDPDQVAATVRGLWALPEREFQYLGCAVSERAIRRMPAAFLATLETAVTTTSWWDTVDRLASRSVGPLVAGHPELRAVMDSWAGCGDMWLARTAILHQLRSGADTDADRLFAYCRLRSGDTEFFIRKAIGWALRQYARTDPDAVRAFVAAERDRLSPLSVREATRHLG